jgi:hypothetical protein
MLLLLFLLLLLHLATYSAGFRCGPVSDAESLRASHVVKAQDDAQNLLRFCGCIPQMMCQWQSPLATDLRFSWSQ